MPYCLLTDLQKEISDEELIALTNDDRVGSDSAGNTDGATGVITDMADTSFFQVDGYVTVSAGFSTTGPLKVLFKSSHSITLDQVSNSIQSGVTVETAINDDNINAAIARAGALIDSYCGQVATVPFSIIPPVIKQHSITIAIYFLFSRRSVAPEIRKDNYKDAIAHLRDISTGKATIGATTAADYEDKAEFSSEERIFTRGKLKGY